MPRKNLGKLLLIILILVSGCSVVEKSKEQTAVNENKLQEIDKAVGMENATAIVEGLATSIGENKEESTQPEIIANKKVSLVVDFGDESKTAPVEFKDGMTAYDALKKATEDLKINLETQMYSMGIFIEAIGDKKNGQENNYWTYYVNDKFANVATDKYKLKAGDKVKWKFGSIK